MVRGYQDWELTDEVWALLMIEVDGPRHGLDEAVDAVAEAAAVPGLVGIAAPAAAAEAHALWRARKALSPALRNIAPKKINEDVVVPVSRMPAVHRGSGAGWPRDTASPSSTSATPATATSTSIC